MSSRSRRAALARVARRASLVALRALAVLVTVAFVAGMATLAVWPPINAVETGATPEYPELVPRAYDLSQARVVAAVQEAAASHPRIVVTSVDVEAGLVLMEAPTRSGLWTDDMIARVEQNGEGGAIVFVESRSREGVADFGQNARNIRQLLTLVDGRLGIR